MRGYDYEEVLKKWEIDVKEYNPWIPAVNVVKVFDAYKEKWEIKRDAELSEKTGLPKQQISYVRVKARSNQNLMTVRALAIVDQMGLDPRFLLIEKGAGSPQEEASKALEVLFLDSYTGETERAAMIKYRQQIKMFVQKLASQERTRNSERVKELLGV